MRQKQKNQIPQSHSSHISTANSQDAALSGVSNSGCPKCGCNKIAGDGSKAWCLNEKCDFVTTDC